MTEPRHRAGQVDALFGRPVAFAAHSSGYREAELIGAASGSRHTYLFVAELAPGGQVERHRHTHEEAFYVLQGEVELTVDGSVSTLPRGSFGLIDVDQSHAWRTVGDAPARWVSMNSPLPVAGDPAFDAQEDALGDGAPTGQVRPLALVPVRERGIAGYQPGDMTEVSIDWLVDAELGADLLKLFMVRYGPGGSMSYHEHPFEELYLVLDGEVRATADGVELDLGPGDFLWAGVGCVHSFVNRMECDVTWIETQAPQPPRRHPVRFVAPLAAASAVADHNA